MLYTAFGLVFDSDLEFPEFQETANQESDVTIRRGSIQAELDTITGEGALYQLNQSQFKLDVPNVGRYYVENGEAITVEPYETADLTSVRLFLLGSVLAALMHQRGMLPLHASSVETPKGAILFCGQSGVGKSTLAAALRQRGYKVIADDISVIASGENGIPQVMPGFPQQKLWANVLQQINVATTSLERVRPQLEKYNVPLNDDFCSSPVPIYRIYILGAANDVEILEIEPIEGLRKLSPLVKHTYRKHFLVQMGQGKLHTQLMAQLSNRTQIFQAIRSDDLDQLEKFVDGLEQDFCA